MAAPIIRFFVFAPQIAYVRNGPGGRLLHEAVSTNQRLSGPPLEVEPNNCYIERVETFTWSKIMKFVFILILYAIPNAYTTDTATPTVTVTPHEYTSASRCKKAAGDIIEYVEEMDGPPSYQFQCLKKKRVD